MTEYTGWDNYVKEHERFTTGWINNDFDSLVDRVKDLEETLDTYLRTGGNTSARVKDLEKWRDNGYLMDRNNIGRRLKTLDDKVEKSGDDIATIDNVLFEIKHKVKDLERIDRDNHNNNWKNIENVLDRVKDLEELSKPAIEKSLYESMKTRLGQLEEWHKPHNIYHIDKKVWEDIKRYTKGIGQQLPIIMAERIEADYNGLKDAIKQADPSWCKDD